MIVINTPHNPVGKVFTRKELESIAALAEEYNLIVMSDEVVSAPPILKLATLHSCSVLISMTVWCTTEKSMSG